MNRPGFPRHFRANVAVPEDLDGRVGIDYGVTGTGPGGPPVAATRASAGQLPLEFVMDDSMAMNPGNTLSQHKQLMLVARLSKSGNPMAQPGDLEGRTLGVKVGAKGVKLVIDQLLP
jgi:cytochrome c-type biogenesis protein CcmH